MVQLDYRTENSRWGLRGIKFSSWQSYAFTLGYLSNPVHNYELNRSSPSADISMRIERNDNQGAWNKEGRIHFYGTEVQLNNVLPDLYIAGSAGNGSITKRIDSNGYVLSLIEDYGFVLKSRVGYTTADVFPPIKENKENVGRLLCGYLSSMQLSNDLIDECLRCFDDGYSFKHQK